MKARVRRWLGRLQCALDPNWHPGFRGEYRYQFRRSVIAGVPLIPGNGVIYTTSVRYAAWVCVRCGAPKPPEWGSHES